MPRPIVTHLIDDLTAGGVTRVLDYLTNAPDMLDCADQRVVRIAPGTRYIGCLKTDVIVSHLAVSWRMIVPFLSMRAANPWARCIHVEHSYTERFVALNVTHKARFAGLLRLAYGIFDQVIAVSVAQKDWLQDARLVKAAKLTAIPSCVDLSAFRALPAPHGPRRVVGAIGRLEPQKGFDVLVRAFAQTRDPKLELRIFGTGSEEARLRELAAGDSRIRFMGFAADPVAAMAQVDVVAMPSRWEAYGIVAIEALSAGRALLINDVDGLRDHLAYGAVLVERPSTAEWTEALEDIASCPKRNGGNKECGIGDFEHKSITQWRQVLSERMDRPSTAQQSVFP